MLCYGAVKRLPIMIVALLLGLAGQVVPAYAQRWVEATLPPPYDKGFYLDIYFLPSDPQRGWACDMDSGYVVRTTNGGQSWVGGRVVGVGKSCHLEYVQFFASGVGYACGPGGFFKSTDNGATWTEITLPGQLQASSPWGAWFRDENVGWVTGGGCGNNVFARTTNGGASFTAFRTTTPAGSNLSDPLWQSDMPAGEVLAIGNGTLWKSTDDGLSWFVVNATGSTNPWHEEITRYGSSIMVSNASSNCTPRNYIGGGVRWSHNNGQTWQAYETRANMYGAYLVNNSVAWIAGERGNVWYTANGGADWELRNCGLDGRDMDDITFITENVGWVAGDGLFYLAPANRYLTPTALTLTEDCPGEGAIDTIWVHNEDFNDAPWESEFLGQYEYLYKVINVLPYPLPKCDSTPMVIQYRGRDNTTRDAQLRVHIYNADSTEVVATLYADLSGRMRRLTAAPQTDTVVFQARAGQTVERTLDWSRTDLPVEEIQAITLDSGDTTISIAGALPLQVRAAPSTSRTIVRATVADTGWVESRFRVRLMPCERDTFVTVRVLGLSPIINAPNSAAIDAACDSDGRLYIPLQNTGNMTLTISEANLTGSDATAFSVLGMTSGRPGPPWQVPVGGSDTLVVAYTARTGSERAQLILVNDDYTTARGSVTPWVVDLSASADGPSFEVRPMVLDLGQLCRGQEKDTLFRVANTGRSMIYSTAVVSGSHVRGLESGAENVNPDSERTYRFQWSWPATGVVEDTIRVIVQPCDSVETVIVRATIIDDRIELSPPQVTMSSTPGVEVQQTWSLAARTSQTISVTRIALVPPVAGAVIDAPAVPFRMTAGELAAITVRWTPLQEGTTVSTLLVESTAACQPEAQAEVTFVATTSAITVDRQQLDFTAVCARQRMRDTVFVRSESVSPLPLKAPVIVEAGSPFTVVEPSQAVVLQPATDLAVVVEFDPSAVTVNGPIATATLRIEAEQGSSVQDVALRGSALSSVIEADTVIDLGEHDRCDDPMSVTVVFRNSGTVTDVLVLGSQLPSGVAVSATSLLLSPGGSASVTITCAPALLSLGASVVELPWLGTSCGDTVTATVLIRVNEDQPLVVDPPVVDLGTVLVGDVVPSRITLRNTNAVPTFVISAEIEPAGQGWSIVSVPASIRAGDVGIADVQFAPTSAGSVTCQLIIITQTACLDTHVVDLRAEVLDRPRYTAVIRADRYRVNPYDRVDVPITLVSDIRDAKPTELSVTVQYSPLLFRVDQVSSQYPDATVSSVQVDGSVTIRAVASGEGFGAAGDLAVLSGTAIPSIPDSTTIDITNSTLLSVEAVEIVEIDGLVQINMCGPYNAIRFRKPTTIQIGAPHPVSSELQLMVDAHTAHTGSIRLVDPNGALAAEWVSVLLPEGPSTITLPLGNIAAGMYIVEVHTSIGGVFTVPVVVLP